MRLNDSGDPPEVLSRAGLQILSHVHTRKIACVTCERCVRCGVLFAHLPSLTRESLSSRQAQEPVIFGVSPLRVGSCFVSRVRETEEELQRNLENHPRRSVRGVAHHPHHSDSHRSPKKGTRLWAGLTATRASGSLRKQVTDGVVLTPMPQAVTRGLSFQHGGTVRG